MKTFHLFAPYILAFRDGPIVEIERGLGLDKIDLGGLFEGIEGMIGSGIGLVITIINIVIIASLVLLMFFGSTIGWNLSRKSIEDPNKLERPWWYKLMTSFGFGILLTIVVSICGIFFLNLIFRVIL